MLSNLMSMRKISSNKKSIYYNNRHQMVSILLYTIFLIHANETITMQNKKGLSLLNSLY